MSSPTPEAPLPIDAPTAEMLARVRRLMVIAGLTTALGISAILIVIGYRLFRSEDSAPAGDVIAALPKGARVVATGVAGDRILVTLETAGTTEIRSFDARTLKPTGRLRFATEP